ncbi:helix-turn-helix transcriptional regulator [Petroclostridium sp. X23]|uniref:helix-turn-helix domain-containing protein n=1 Tax=Petroclostridium sp. X23 TaxID=3045146 RepID=UPI0024ADC59E|nr:helix-turn-helix transcriptional regulator [Petroclostridium sp. X23]WHH57188.1 helix-turn-helix transcriptional regulator [Petroclostridium sp. X23]
MNVGNRIREIRLRKNKTLDDIAKPLNMTRGAISRVESKDSVDLKLLFKISKVLNVPIHHLIYEDNELVTGIEGKEKFSKPLNIRDLHPNSINEYDRLPLDNKDFISCIALEFEREINRTVNNLQKEHQEQYTMIANEILNISKHIITNFAGNIVHRMNTSDDNHNQLKQYIVDYSSMSQAKYTASVKSILKI